MAKHLVGRHKRHRARVSTRWRLVVGCAIAIGALVAIGALLAAGPANAFWVVSGHGDGAAGTQTPFAVSLSAATPTAQLYPGGSADVLLTIANPNAASVHIGSLALDATGGAGGFDIDAGHPGCSPSALTFATATNAGSGWTVPGAVGSTPGVLPTTLTGAMSMTLDAADQCQGALFTIYLAAGP